MKRGLVIGKFLPLHTGHVALIRFGAAQCDELIVSMSYTVADPIDPSLRLSWIRETVGDTRSIRIEMVADDFDDDTLPMDERTKIWATFIRKKYPKIDVLFSSEEYGDSFGKALGIPHVPFDQERKQFPISATKIRTRPFLYWEFIPHCVRPYFVKKVCLFGPESTGKTTLARYLADVYHTTCVPEVSRELVSSNNFTEEDIIRIGHAQTQRVLEKTRTANKILFCDTDLITTQIYSRQYLHTVPPVLYELEKQVTYDQYFLMGIDAPWIADGLRDLGERREEMYAVFRTELEKRNISYIPVNGSYAERETCIRQHLEQWFTA